MLVVCVNDNWARKDGFIHPRMPANPPQRGHVYRVVRTRPSRRRFSKKYFHLLEEYPGGHAWETEHFRPVKPDALDVFKQKEELVDA